MKNLLKMKLEKGEIAVGTIVTLGHPDITELFSQVGFDWLFLDTEHVSTTLETVQQMMQSMKGQDCTPIVRPPSNDPVNIKRILDIGAYGIIAPMISSKEEAESLVRACRYPPAGIRGFGPRRAGMFDPNYYETANDEILIMALIETAESIKNIDEILSVDGIDVGFIGYADLSLSMGLGLPPKWDEPLYLDVFDKVVNAAGKHGKIAGLHTDLGNGPRSVEWALERGFRIVTVCNVDDYIISGAQSALERARKAADRI